MIGVYGMILEFKVVFLPGMVLVAFDFVCFQA